MAAIGERNESDANTINTIADGKESNKTRAEKLEFCSPRKSLIFLKNIIFSVCAKQKNCRLSRKIV